MRNRTDHRRADDKASRRSLVLMGLSAGDPYRLASLSDAMLTPWQLPPLAALPDTAEPPPHPAAETDTDFVVAWQLRPAES